MPNLATNRQPGQVVSASDINGLATTLNNIFSGSEFSPAVKDVVGALVAAAGGAYNATTKTITLPGAAIADGVTASGTTWSSTQIQNKINALIGAGIFTEAVQDIIGALVVAAGGTYDDNAGTITFPSTGGGGGGGTSDAMRIPASSYGTFQYLTGNETPAQIDAIQNNNDAIFEAAIAANPDKWVVGPEKYVPTHIQLSGKAGMLEARLQHVRGYNDNGYHVQPALDWENPCGSPQSVTVGSWQIGTNQPSGLIFSQTVTTFTLPPSATTGKLQGDYSRYRQGDVLEVYGKTDYQWAADAIAGGVTANASVWRAEAIGVHGVGLQLTSVNLAGINTSTTLERRRIQGAQSGAIAIVNGYQLDATGGTTAKVTFPSVTIDFQNGEDVYDVDQNVKIGVAGAMTIVCFGRTDFTYLASGNPQIRQMSKLRVRTRLDVKGAADPEVWLSPSDRGPSLVFAGLYYPDIEYKVDNVTSRGAQITSCYMGEVRYEAHGISNHALGSGNPYSEQGYGYGAEARGFIYGTKFIGKGSHLRHLFTTNANARTYESDSTAHLDYGCGGQRLVISGEATDCFAAAFDNHEGGYGLIYREAVARRAFGGGRALTDGVGFNNRSHGTQYINTEVDGCWVGYREQGAQSQAGLKHTVLYREARAINFQNRGWLCNGSYDGSTNPAQGVAQDGTTQLGIYATIRLENTLARGDGQTTGNPYFQAGYEFGWGVYESFNMQTERVGMPVWFKGIAATVLGGQASDPKRGGQHRHTLPRFDYSEVPIAVTANPSRLDAEFDVFDVTGKVRIVQRTATQPAFVFDSKSGATVVENEGVAATCATDTASSKAADPGMLTVSSGTGTSLNRGGSGGSGSSGTQITIDGGAPLSAMDINSTSPIIIKAINAEVAGPATSANVADVSAFQQSLPAGEWLVEAELYYQVSTGTAGSLRLGLGGAGSSVASISNARSTQWTSLTAPVNVILNVLAASGSAAVVTAGSANVAGSSPGSFGSTLPWFVSGKITLTATGVVGIIAQLSAGADRTAKFMPGSWVRFTRVS